MRVDLENSKFSMFFCNGFEETKWRTVIATKKTNEFSFIQQVDRLIIDPFDHEFPAFINFPERLAHEGIFLQNLTLRNIINIEFSFFSQVIAFEKDFFIGMTHIETLLPQILVITIKKVHLHTGFEDMFSSAGSSSCITNGYFP